MLSKIRGIIVLIQFSITVAIVVVAMYLFRSKTHEIIKIWMKIQIYLLGIKWTLDFLKMSKYKSYTSILLGIPIYYSIEYLTNLQFVSIFNLTVASFIHHLIRNKISCSIDEFFILLTLLLFILSSLYSSTDLLIDPIT